MDEQFLLKRSRKREVVEKRQIGFLWLMKRGFKPSHIALAFSMDHSTILHDTQTIKNLAEKYEDIKENCLKLNEFLLGKNPPTPFV